MGEGAVEEEQPGVWDLFVCWACRTWVLQQQRRWHRVGDGQTIFGYCFFPRVWG